MKVFSFTTFIYDFIYRTAVLEEFIPNWPKSLQIFLITISEAQVVKYCLDHQALLYGDQVTPIEKFIQYLIRPHLYFFQNHLQLEYSIIVFILIQMMYLYWIYIVFLGYIHQEKENYIEFVLSQQSFKFQEILLIIWKYVFIFLSEYIGYQLIEGAFMMIFKTDLQNPFCMMSSIFVILQIILIIVLQDLFMGHSLHYMPKQLNQQIKSTPFTLIQKLTLLIIIVIYSNQIQNEILFLVLPTILYSLLSLYNNLVIKIKVDLITIKISIFCKSLIICICLEQLLRVFCPDEKFKLLWIILGLMASRVLAFQQIKYQSIQILTLKFSSTEQQKTYSRNKLHYYQNITQSQGSEYKIINKIILKEHQRVCLKESCLCRNEELRMMKVEQILMKECIDEKHTILKQESQQSASFYINLLQSLIYQKSYFEALNLSQKVINSINSTTSLYKKTICVIKEQVSLKNLIILKILEQIILIQIKLNVQKKITISSNSNAVGLAIKQFQCQCDTKKELLQKFEETINMKIEILTLFFNQGFLDYSKLETITLNTIAKIETFKQSLRYKFRQTPTSHNQALLMFLQVEILNDLINSQNINNVNTIFEEYEKNQNTNQIFSQLESQFSYIKLSIKDEENIDIDETIIKKKFKQIKQNYENYEDLIPDSLQQIHKLQIRNFFQIGTNKFYLNITDSFLKLSNAIIIPIQMCMDFQFDRKNNQLYATVFMKTSHSQNLHYIFLDLSFKIKEISQDLYFSLLKFPQNKKMMLYDQHINAYIQNFQGIDYKTDTPFGPTEIIFPIGNQSSITKNHSQNILEQFIGLVTLKVKKFNSKTISYIIEIQDLKSKKKDELKSITRLEIEGFEEEEVVNVPLDILSEKEQISQLTFQFQKNVHSRLDSQRALINKQEREVIEQFDTKNLLNEDSDVNIVSKASNKSPVTNEQAKQFDEGGSQISSVAAVKRSIYYQQFYIINELIFSKIFPSNVKKFNVLFISYLIFVLTNSVLLINEVLQLSEFQDYISLISIKYDIYEPIENFLNTRYTITNLQIAVYFQLITQKQYNEIATFPKSQLTSGYDNLKEKVFEVLSKPQFQPYLQNNYLVSKWYETTTTSSTKNITFRSGLLALLDYQYDFKLAYTIKSLVIDSPYFYYSYKNYISLFNKIAELNTNVLQQLNTTLLNQSKDFMSISIPFAIFSGLFLILYSFYLIKQRKVKNRLLNLLLQPNKDIIQNEIQRLIIISNKIKANQQIMSQYKLNLMEFDNNLQQQEKEFRKLCKVQNNKYKKQKEIKVYNAYQIMVLLIKFTFYSLVIFLTSNSLMDYNMKAQNTANIYQQLSDTGVDVLIIYAEREVLYYRTFAAVLDQQDYKDLSSQIDDSLQSISQFSVEILKINLDDYLLDDGSYQLFQDVNSNSLCNYLPEEFASVSITLCPTVLQGVLTQGLQSTLLLMYNSISQEKQINNFTNRNPVQTPIVELQGATFTAKVIKQLVTKLYSNLQDFTNQIKESFTIIYIFFIIFEIVTSLLIIIFFNKFEKSQIDYLRKIVYLLPQGTLVFDEQFQRSIKHLIRVDQLI